MVLQRVFYDILYPFPYDSLNKNSNSSRYFNAIKFILRSKRRRNSPVCLAELLACTWQYKTRFHFRPKLDHSYFHTSCALPADDFDIFILKSSSNTNSKLRDLLYQFYPTFGFRDGYMFSIDFLGKDISHIKTSAIRNCRKIELVVSS